MSVPLVGCLCQRCRPHTRREGRHRRQARRALVWQLATARPGAIWLGLLAVVFVLTLAAVAVGWLGWLYATAVWAGVNVLFVIGRWWACVRTVRLRQRQGSPADANPDGDPTTPADRPASDSAGQPAFPRWR